MAQILEIMSIGTMYMPHIVLFSVCILTLAWHRDPYCHRPTGLQSILLMSPLVFMLIMLLYADSCAYIGDTANAPQWPQWIVRMLFGIYVFSLIIVVVAIRKCHVILGFIVIGQIWFAVSSVAYAMASVCNVWW